MVLLSVIELWDTVVLILKGILRSIVKVPHS